MNKLKIIHSIIAGISGFILIGYGGMDDSPGAQGIGLLTLILSCIILISYIRNMRKG